MPRRAPLLLLAVLGLCSALTFATPAHADDLTDGCVDSGVDGVPEIGPRACASTQAGVRLVAQLCRQVPGLDEVACNSIDQREIHEAGMKAYQKSWTAKALDLQSRLDLDAPLTRALIPSTHNSANSAADQLSVSNLDPNQVVSLTDQLRLGIRGLELDAHWAPNPAGDPANGMNAVVQCHGEPVDTGTGVVVHAGCSVDGLLIDRLKEIRTWLNKPANAHEFVLLYLENNLDGDETAHAEAVKAIKSTLGSLVFRPRGSGCQSLPMNRSKASFLHAGKRVLLTGNCGPGGWNSWVFQRGAAWDESGDSSTYLQKRTCAQERAKLDYAHHFIRQYEDSTWLTAMADGERGGFGTATTKAMVRCGVNLIGFDQLYSGDARLSSLVWSWAKDYPDANPKLRCAAQRPDARFVNYDCHARHHVGCRRPDGTWIVTEIKMQWRWATFACQAMLARFDVPVNGFDNDRLRAATILRAGREAVWVDYGLPFGGRWTPRLV